MTESDQHTHLDQIHIRDLRCRCIIGVNEDERREKQDIVVHVTMYADLQKACRTDDIHDSVDYRAVKKGILKIVEDSRYRLVEALAEGIAQECLRHEKVHRVRVAVEKPGALRFARTAGVQITRWREGGDE